VPKSPLAAAVAPALAVVGLLELELPDRPQPAAPRVTTVSGTANRRTRRQWVIPTPRVRVP
jgi:hypothetical protein